MKKCLILLLFLPQLMTLAQSRDPNYERPNTYLPSSKKATITSKHRLHSVAPKGGGGRYRPSLYRRNYEIFKKRNSVDYYGSGEYWAARVREYSLDRLTDKELQMIKVRKKGDTVQTSLYDYIVNSSPERVRSLFGVPTSVWTRTIEESEDSYTDYAYGVTMEDLMNYKGESGIYYGYIAHPFNESTKSRVDNFARKSPIYKYMDGITWFNTDEMYLEIPNNLMYNTVLHPTVNAGVGRKGKTVRDVTLVTPLTQEEQGLGVTTVKCGDDGSVLAKIFPLSYRYENRGNTTSPDIPNYRVTVTTDIYSAYSMMGDFNLAEGKRVDPYRSFVEEENLLSFYYVDLEFSIIDGKIVRIHVNYHREYYEP